MGLILYVYKFVLIYRTTKTPGVLIDFLTLVQRGLHAQVTTVRTAKEGIRHEMSTARTPEQNGVVERQNRTLVEAARTMLSAAKVPLDGENLDKMKEKDNVICTDNAKISRKQSKTGQSRARERKSTQRAGRMLSKINGLKAVRNQGWRLDEGGASCDAR
ncbi:ribonuclease H-like domain-containing protein, partial [Tanacetum coccineum]